MSNIKESRGPWKIKFEKAIEQTLVGIGDPRNSQLPRLREILEANQLLGFVNRQKIDQLLPPAGRFPGGKEQDALLQITPAAVPDGPDQRLPIREFQAARFHRWRNGRFGSDAPLMASLDGTGSRGTGLLRRRCPCNERCPLQNRYRVSHSGLATDVDHSFQSTGIDSAPSEFQLRRPRIRLGSKPPGQRRIIRARFPSRMPIARSPKPTEINSS